MAPKVSVIVPAYGIEKYLRQFLDTLINQTLKDIEIIIVNDASPDGSHNIITEYLKDERIVYIHKDDNEGPIKARQDAYEASIGETVINLDPDDYIDLDYLEKMYKFLNDNELDIVTSNVEFIDEKNKPVKRRRLKKIKRSFVLKEKKIIEYYWELYMLLGVGYLGNRC